MDGGRERVQERKTPNIYPNLRKEMGYHNHRISDLAKLIRCNEQTLRNWLCGRHSMEIYFAVQISKVYERSVDYLFQKEGA